jgi:hypothetical protein
MPKYNWKDLRKEIKENHDLIWWVDSEGKIITQGRDNDKLKKEVLKKNKDEEIFKLYLSFHTGKNYGQGGVLAINVKNYDNNLKKINGDKNGRYWIKESVLNSLGWRESFITQVIKKITKKNFKFTLGIHNL